MSSPIAAASSPVRVVMLYDTEEAGRQAVKMVAGLRHESAAVVAQPWCTDALAQIDARCHAWADVARADYLVLALSHSSAVPESVQRWLSIVLATPRDGGITMLVSIDSTDVWTLHLEALTRTRGDAGVSDVWSRRPAMTWTDVIVESQRVA